MFEVALEECASIEALNEAEARWIQQLGTFGRRGYNCTSGGDGFTVRPETKAKVSRARKGRPLSDTHRAAIAKAMAGTGNAFYGKHHSPGTVEQIKATLRQHFTGEGNPFFGHTHTAETRARLSTVNKGRVVSERAREAVRKAQIGNTHTKGRVLTVEHKTKYAKLDVAAVLHIRRNPDGLSTAELASKFSVTWWTVHNVIIGKTWRNVEGDSP